MLRLFVGIDLPPAEKLQLSLLCRGLHGVKWIDPGNFHVTLRFIGEVDEGVATDIDAALATLRLPAFPLAIAGVGFFGPPEKPRLIYAGVEKSAALTQLHEKVETALTRAGQMPEGRRFTPHISLARVMAGNPAEIGHFIEAHNLLRLPPIHVDRFHLVQSYLTKAGSIYEDVAEYPLA